MTEVTSQVVPLRWNGDRTSGYLSMLDQRRLPHEEVWHDLRSAPEVANGIRDMVIRGAPAIGIAAAFGLYLGVRALDDERDLTADSPVVRQLMENLKDTRPTAVNLFWALSRMSRLLQTLEGKSRDVVLDALFEEAQTIFSDDRSNNLELGRLGAEELSTHGDQLNVLTHCNTGGLATGGFGTALGIVRVAHAQGILKHVWVDETRPYLQGARLTAWECMRDSIPATLITDSMAAHFMQQGRVDAVVVGTDRVASNGDVANKIGTYGLAVLCAYHGIPFYVAAPVSTVDLATPSGEEIAIEQRSMEEVTHVQGVSIAPAGVAVEHPAFDVTPAALVTAIVTERGVVRAPYSVSLRDLVDQ